MGQNLYRSKSNRVISGVCGGIAEYFNLDATLIRILWALLTLSLPIGFIGYILCVLIIPENPYGYVEENSTFNYAPSKEKNIALMGLILIILGAILLIRRYFSWFNFHTILPFLLIGGGIYVIYKGRGVR